MILYRPTDGEIFTKPIRFRPRTLTQLGQPIPAQIAEIRHKLTTQLRRRKIEAIDADSEVTGRDFLMTIWEMILAVPLGIAIISEELLPATLANIFYEIGLLQAAGKESLVIKTPEVQEMLVTQRADDAFRRSSFDRHSGEMIKQFLRSAPVHARRAERPRRSLSRG